MANITPTVAVKGLTARDLYSRSDRSAVHDAVYEQVKAIDAAILAANVSGFSRIEHELPTSFTNINNLSKADAQTLVYSEILMIYKLPEPDGKGFTDTHILLGHRSILVISWLNGMESAERDTRQQFVRDCMFHHIPDKSSARAPASTPGHAPASTPGILGRGKPSHRNFERA
jgi:hypothetical protein